MPGKESVMKNAKDMQEKIKRSWGDPWSFSSLKDVEHRKREIKQNM